MHDTITTRNLRKLADRAAENLSTLAICAHCGVQYPGGPPAARGERCAACDHVSVWGVAELLSWMTVEEHHG